MEPMLRQRFCACKSYWMSSLKNPSIKVHCLRMAHTFSPALMFWQPFGTGIVSDLSWAPQKAVKSGREIK